MLETHFIELGTCDDTEEHAWFPGQSYPNNEGLAQAGSSFQMLLCSSVGSIKLELERDMCVGQDAEQTRSSRKFYCDTRYSSKSVTFAP